MARIPRSWFCMISCPLYLIRLGFISWLLNGYRRRHEILALIGFRAACFLHFGRCRYKCSLPRVLIPNEVDQGTRRRLAQCVLPSCPRSLIDWVEMSSATRVMMNVFALSFISDIWPSDSRGWHLGLSVLNVFHRPILEMEHVWRAPSRLVESFVNYLNLILLDCSTSNFMDILILLSLCLLKFCIWRLGPKILIHLMTAWLEFPWLRRVRLNNAALRYFLGTISRSNSISSTCC